MIDLDTVKRSTQIRPRQVNPPSQILSRSDEITGMENHSQDPSRPQYPVRMRNEGWVSVKDR